MTRRILAFVSLIFLASLAPLAAQIGETNNTVVVITSDASNYVLHAGGTVAKMIEDGMEGILIRIGNDEKDSWDLSPEETALRTKQESEAAAKILGIDKVISLGFRSSDFRDVPFTTMRDRLAYYIRVHKPRVLFIPNPHTQYDRNHDRYYGGRAAEDAWRAAAFKNYLPAMKDVSLGAHVTPEVYYFAPLVDPARREPRVHGDLCAAAEDDRYLRHARKEDQSRSGAEDHQSQPRNEVETTARFHRPAVAAARQSGRGVDQQVGRAAGSRFGAAFRRRH